MITCHKEMSCHGHVTFAIPTGNQVWSINDKKWTERFTVTDDPSRTLVRGGEVRGPQAQQQT
jgi:hypothetical protein